MRITSKQLRQIIKEELQRALLHEGDETQASIVKSPSKSATRYVVFLDGNIVSASGSPKPMTTEALVPFLAKNIRAKQLMLQELDSKNGPVGDWIDMKNTASFSLLKPTNPALASISYTAATLIGIEGSGALPREMSRILTQLRNSGYTQGLKIDGTFTIGAEGYTDVKLVIKDTSGNDLSDKMPNAAGGIKSKSTAGSPIEYTFTYGARAS
jgi:hypothetical protein